jgi:hypothetical protein
MAVFIRYDGNWVPTLVSENVWGRISGQWKQGQDMWIRHEGSWKLVTGNNPPQNVTLSQPDPMVGDAMATWSLPTLEFSLQSHWQTLISGTWTDWSFDNLSAGVTSQTRTFADNTQVRFRIRYSGSGAPNTDWTEFKSIIISIVT